ncbi:alpha-ketoacid dehydrogenase subunit beta [Streptomyces sp. NBC_01431]|uniref:alpha-ketoacid dehydrogenase subunit beta n=1 Tax=Streptomyces sp. NBC_01431 TaxID=2903863 RepID=UPI002E382347|nr:transketolase C-terminal domain-containing protein [Streptomyces sp. NBC_01431]
MSGGPRLVDDLNRALHTVMAEDDRLYLLGEDIADPYGGAFKVTRGLSTAFPGRTLSTPISEQALLGVANGLALQGDRAIVEIMFGDFAALAFDQLLNVSGKAGDMYGDGLAMHLVVRCPSGGYRGYGPTHSQSLQKHFIGIPNLQLFELTPFHPNREVFRHMLGLGKPCLFFEEKTLYATKAGAARRRDVPFACRLTGAAPGTALLSVEEPEQADCLIVAPGGMAHLALEAAELLLLEDERVATVAVPSRLYPLDVDPLARIAARTGRVLVVDQGTGGGTWAETVAHQLHTRLWGRLHRPVAIVHSKESVIPAAGHLERRVLVQRDWITAVLRELLDV